MSRLPLVDPEQTTGELRAAFDKMPLKLNIFRMMAHAETCALPLMRLGNAILHRQTLGERPRELLILQVARIEGGTYEWRQHVAIAEGVGVSTGQIEAIEHGRYDDAAFSAAERALLAFGRSVIESVRVDAEVFAEAQRHYSDREIVEAILTVGFYMMMARLTEATETDLDPAVGMTLYASGKRRPTSTA